MHRSMIKEHMSHGSLLHCQAALSGCNYDTAKEISGVKEVEQGRLRLITKES